MNKDTVILIPIYDPDENISNAFFKVLTKQYDNIVFVNDGSKKEHDKFFNDLEKKYPVIKHNVNLGKGRALKNGLNYILNNYPNIKVIVTADCDGQHSVEDITKCMEECKKNNDSLILGVRNFKEDDVPFKSKFGNNLTKNVLRNLIGEKVSDTQTGLRAMSRETAKRLLQVAGERYEYETNVLIACKQLNIDIKEVIIKTIYINGNATTHFNPIKDSYKIYRLFFRPILVCFIFYLLELFLFNKLLCINNDLYIAIPLSLLIAKLISNMFIYVLNKHISLIKLVCSYILVCGVLLLLIPYNISIILIKVIIDLIILLISLL